QRCRDGGVPADDHRQGHEVDEQRRIRDLERGADADEGKAPTARDVRSDTQRPALVVLELDQSEPAEAGDPGDGDGEREEGPGRGIAGERGRTSKPASRRRHGNRPFLHPRVVADTLASVKMRGQVAAASYGPSDR